MRHEGISAGVENESKSKSEENSFEVVTENDVVKFVLENEETSKKLQEAQKKDAQETESKMNEVREKLGLKTNEEQEEKLQQIRDDGDVRVAKIKADGEASLGRLQEIMDKTLNENEVGNNNTEMMLEGIQRVLADRLNVNKVEDIDYTPELFSQDMQQMNMLRDLHQDEQSILDHINKYEENVAVVKRGVAYEAENNQNEISNELEDDESIKLQQIKEGRIEQDNKSRNLYIDIIKNAGVEINENVEDVETYELEYRAGMAAHNLMKEGSIFENGEDVALENTSEKFGTDMEALLEEMLSIKPMNYEKYSGVEYNEDRFVADTGRQGWLGIAIEIAEGEMEFKLRYEKEKRMKLGDENAQKIFEEEMKKLANSYEKATARYENFPDEISDAYEASIREGLAQLGGVEKAQ